MPNRISLGTGSLLLAEDSGLHLWDTLSTALLVGAILAPLVIPALISWSERRYSVALYDDRLAIGERARDPDPFPKTIAYADVVELSGTGRGFAMWLCGGRCLCFATDRLQAEDATDFLARRTSVEGGPESASC